MENKDYLLLKWGSLKSYCFANSPEALEAAKEYYDCDFPPDSSGQKHSPRQQELLFTMIDKVNGPVENWWTGEAYDDRERAKQYIQDYGK